MAKVRAYSRSEKPNGAHERNIHHGLVDEIAVVSVPVCISSARTVPTTPGAGTVVMAEDTATTCPPPRSTARRLADGGVTSVPPPTLWPRTSARSRATHFSAAARAVRAAVASAPASVAEVPVAHASCSAAALDLRARDKVEGSRRSTTGWCELIACCGVVTRAIEKKGRGSALGTFLMVELKLIICDAFELKIKFQRHK